MMISRCIQNIFNNKLIFVATIIVVFLALPITTTQAIEKPTYLDYMRVIYGYDEDMTDEEIVKKHLRDDKSGRAFFQTPKTLKGDKYDGYGGVVDTLPGYSLGLVSLDVDLSNLSIIAGDVIIEYYNQGDYPGQMYGGHSIQATACGPTSIYMILKTYIEGFDMTLPQFCQWCAQHGYQEASSGASYRSLIPDAARAFGLQVREIVRSDVNSLASALSQGHPVVEICGPGYFTTGGHFIVLTGIDENGMVSVNDPGSRRKSTIYTGAKYSLNTMVSNASTKLGVNTVTYWEIYRPGE